MRRFYKFTIFIALAMGLTACPGPFADRNGKFQSTPVNLEEINSEFDDYNSNLPLNKHGQDYLIFSSKRDRKDKFNLVVKPFELVYDDRTDKLDAKSDAFSSNLDVSKHGFYYNQLVQKANQNCNVLGPMLLPLDRSATGQSDHLPNRYLLLYADDSAGDLQIKFVHNLTDQYLAEGPFEVSWLNGPKDDAYPTFAFAANTMKLYFCSDREGNFDIFEVALPGGQKELVEALLSQAPQEVIKNTKLSTPYDDKCPYFASGWWSGTMYFTSNRPGGQGGFDLYYAQLNGTTWTSPVNLGSRINTAYDEYRPMIPQKLGDFNYHLGLFSSNRPGGKGGFDLYMAGFLKSEETKLSD